MGLQRLFLSDSLDDESCPPQRRIHAEELKTMHTETLIFKAFFIILILNDPSKTTSDI